MRYDRVSDQASRAGQVILGDSHTKIPGLYDRVFFDTTTPRYVVILALGIDEC